MDIVLAILALLLFASILIGILKQKNDKPQSPTQRLYTDTQDLNIQLMSSRDILGRGNPIAGIRRHPRQSWIRPRLLLTIKHLGGLNIHAGYVSRKIGAVMNAGSHW